MAKRQMVEAIEKECDRIFEQAMQTDSKTNDVKNNFNDDLNGIDTIRGELSNKSKDNVLVSVMEQYE